MFPLELLLLQKIPAPPLKKWGPPFVDSPLYEHERITSPPFWKISGFGQPPCRKGVPTYYIFQKKNRWVVKPTYFVGFCWVVHFLHLAGCEPKIFSMCHRQSIFIFLTASGQLGGGCAAKGCKKLKIKWKSLFSLLLSLNLFALLFSWHHWKSRLCTFLPQWSLHCASFWSVFTPHKIWYISWTTNLPETFTVNPLWKAQESTLEIYKQKTLNHKLNYQTRQSVYTYI